MFLFKVGRGDITGRLEPVFTSSKMLLAVNIPAIGAKFADAIASVDASLEICP